MSTEMMSVEDFRAEAREWIRANLEPKALPQEGQGRREALTEADMVKARALQKKLFDGGFAGISSTNPRSAPT